MSKKSSFDGIATAYEACHSIPVKQLGGDATANNTYTPQYAASPVHQQFEATIIDPEAFERLSAVAKAQFLAGRQANIVAPLSLEATNKAIVAPLYDNPPQYVSSPGFLPVEYATAPHTVSVSRPLPTMPTYSPGVTYLAQARPVSVSTPQHFLRPTSPQPQIVMRPYSPQPQIVTRSYSPQPEIVTRSYSPQPEIAMKPYSPQPQIVMRPYSPQPQIVTRSYSPQPEIVMKPYSPQPLPTAPPYSPSVTYLAQQAPTVIAGATDQTMMAPTYSIGVSFYCARDEHPVIDGVDLGSPAHNAGLLKGDRVLSVSATSTHADLDDSRSTSVRPTILGVVATAKTEVKGFDGDQMAGLMKKTFDAASPMIVQVERGQGSGVKLLEKVLKKVEKAPLQTMMAPTYSIGVSFYCARDEHPVIDGVDLGSPAHNAGLLKGDRVLSVSATSTHADLDDSRSTSVRPTILGVVSTAKTEVKGFDGDQMAGLMKKTFDAASSMIVQVERGQGSGVKVLEKVLKKVEKAPLQYVPSPQAPLQYATSPTLVSYTPLQYATSPTLVSYAPLQYATSPTLVPTPAGPPQYATSPPRVVLGPNHMAPMQVLAPPQYVTSPQRVQSGLNHMSSMQVLAPPQYSTSPQLVQSDPNHMSSMQALGPITWDNAPGFAPMTPTSAMFEPLREMPAPGGGASRYPGTPI